MPRALRISLLSSLVVFVLALGNAAPALASHSVNLTVDQVQRIDATTIRVSGTIRCTRGGLVGSWIVGVLVDQRGRQGTGGDGDPCSFNSTEPWSVDATGGPFRGGRVTVTVTGTVCVVDISGTHCTSETQTLRVKPSRG
jgi:hypothetical protein